GIAMKSLNIIDKVVFKNIYLSFLERIIFIYFQKKNFKSAYRYAFLKRNYLNLDNHDEVNRWYLEMAYIYAELNQRDKASSHLQAILSNFPDEPLKALTLSNLTKLYIDDGLIAEAKKTLSEGMKLVDKLKDYEGKMYCEYLNAKLLLLEKNYKYAKQSFHDLFHKIPVLTSDYMGILNEYLELLINLEQWDDFEKLILKYQKAIENSDDLVVKKMFYRNILKQKITRDKNLKEVLKPILTILDTLESQIVKRDSDALETLSEDEKNLEINAKLRLLIEKIEKTIVLSNLASLSDNERGCFMEFSKHLEKIVGFQEALFIVFSKANFATLPEFFENFNQVSSYEYKKQRLYEREIPYSNLNGTIVEMLVTANHEIMIDFQDSSLPLKNVLNDKLYTSSLVQSLIAIPLHYEQELFACAIFTANDSSLLDVDSMALLKIGCKLLEFKLISLFYQESLRSQKNILQIAMNSLQDGMFYFDHIKKRMICTSQLSQFLRIDEQMLDRTEYNEFINIEDQRQFSVINEAIAQGNKYEVQYRLTIGNQEINVKEAASPYINKEGMIKFYVGTIRKIEHYIPISQQKFAMDDENAFSLFIDELKSKTKDLDFKFALARFQILNLHDLNSEVAMQTTKYFYQQIKNEFSETTFYLPDGTFCSFLDISDQRVLDRKIRSVLEKSDRGLRYQNFNINFETKASLVRYPRDSFNIDELITFSEISLRSSERYQVFSDEIHKKYLKMTSISYCLQEQLRKSSVDILLLELILKKPGPKSFLVQYNIPGLMPKESITEFASDLVLVPFQILAIKQLFREMNPENNLLYYINLSTKAIEILLKDQFFTNHYALFQHVVIIIEDYSTRFEKLFGQLGDYHVKVMVSNRIFMQLNFTLLADYSIFGVCVNDVLSHQERINLLKFCQWFDLELLTNFDYLEYQNGKYKSEKLISLVQNDEK
ncbi:MAG: hypothetical protein PHP65_02920, partial [Bacilli bacterium]|nr:hypothetical protein [Bacilli bacterium]